MGVSAELLCVCETKCKEDRRMDGQAVRLATKGGKGEGKRKGDA